MITLYPRTFLRSAWPMVSDLLPLTLTLPGRVFPLSEPLVERPQSHSQDNALAPLDLPAPSERPNSMDVRNQDHGRVLLALQRPSTYP